MRNRKYRKRKEILPISDISISAWPEQNFLFAILSGIPTGYDWLMNTHIQLRGSHYIHYAGGNIDSSVTFYPYSMHNLTPNMYDLCPFIEKYTLPKELVLSDFCSFHEFAIFALLSGYYISTYMDQYFRTDISGIGYHHPNFVYGFDDETKELYLADNFENNKYGYKKISYQQADKAFELVNGNSWEVSVFLYRIKEYRHTFHPEYVREQIVDYLNPGRGLCYLDRTVCMNPHHNDDEYLNEVYYGIECYELIQKYLTGIKNKDENFIDGDWRSFSMLRDHKQIMLERYDFMTSHGYSAENDSLRAAFVQQVKDCEVMLNMFIKYNITGDNAIIDRLSCRLSECLENDKKNLGEFLDTIRI